jgi:hypothetical protein
MSVEPAVVATSAQMDAVQRAEAGLEEEVVDALADEMGGPPLRPKPVKTKTSSPHPADRVGA